MVLLSILTVPRLLTFIGNMKEFLNLEEEVEVTWFSRFLGFLDSIMAAIISEDPTIVLLMILPFSSFLNPSSVTSGSSVVLVSLVPA